MVTTPGKAATAFLIAVALFLSSCQPEPAAYSAGRQPRGIREPLHTGHWRGQMNMTEVDFVIQQVSERTVTVRLSGTVLRQANNKSLQNSDTENYFYDRPRICKRIADGKSFDCTRYTDMHIDNGLLCGVYESSAQVFRPCFQPLP